MRIIVCVRQGLDGEISPFDACAYEAALQQKNAEIILLSMGPASVEDFLVRLTRLGASKAVLLTDKKFAGADTLATAYTLSMAIKKLEPDLVFCGRQTLVGDTGQVGPMIASMLSFGLITNAMTVSADAQAVRCTTRSEGELSSSYPAVVTVERINKLRLPSLRSRIAECIVWSAEDIKADSARIGLVGSPTRVLETFENKEGKRRCEFISRDRLKGIIETLLTTDQKHNTEDSDDGVKLPTVLCVGLEPLKYAKMICDDPEIVSVSSAEEIISVIANRNPDAVIFGSDDKSKALAATVSAKLSLGLCADCTLLKTDGNKVTMYRPALSGSIIARIESLTRPCLATVRTTTSNVSDIVVAVGYGAKDKIEAVTTFAEGLDADLAATRKVVDNDILPYSFQVGLTGRSVSPKIYIAIGVSGAVHHIAGMQRSGTVIAINPDKNAPIFDYADYGILEEFN